MKDFQNIAVATLVALVTFVSRGNAEYVGVKYCIEDNLNNCHEIFTQDAGENIHACFNIPFEDNDKIKSFKISNGDICRFWANYNCNGAHTRVYSGTTNSVSELKGKISSLRCCRDTDKWCADGA
ncbi:hypothetical protein GQ44DRAFT_712655 [Phaeosphaeriaceae sp. PMI808]|nr:hypothetical protein GQ44DRAFT_712655 [Phaeosphaeriaceae sp. PMI808]